MVLLATPRFYWQPAMVIIFFFGGEFLRHLEEGDLAVETRLLCQVALWSSPLKVAQASTLLKKIILK